MATKDTKKEVRTMALSAKEEEARRKPGGSNAGEYPNVSDENFAGNSCGLPGAYPIDTMERARSALSYAHNAEDPDCIRRAVYKKWPSLDPSKR